MRTSDPLLGLTTPERLARADGQFEATNTDAKILNKNHRNTIRMLDGSTLERLFSHHTITADQYYAGCRFYRDWYASGLAASGVVDMEKPIVDNSPKPDPVAKLSALGSYAKAIQAIGIVHSHAVTAIVLVEEPLEDYGLRRHRQADRRLARLAATVSLRDGLDALDLYYNGKRRKAYTHGGVPGYRPEIVKQG